jgi:hypothetical protein
MNHQNTQRRTLATERVEFLKTTVGGRAAQFLRTQFEHHPETPVWGTFMSLADEISKWGLDPNDQGHEKIKFALTRQRYGNRLSKEEAAAYAIGYKQNPNSKISKNFIPLVEGSSKQLIKTSIKALKKEDQLGWVGYDNEQRERMLQRKPGSDKLVDWNAFYYASTKEQAQGYGANLARVVVSKNTSVMLLRINDAFFASNLPGDYKAARLKKELAIDQKHPLMPTLGTRVPLYIVSGLDGLDSESERENIVPWSHAQAYLSIEEVRL